MKSISKFLLSTLAMLLFTLNAYASGLEVSVNDKRIITVAGETESDCVYIKVNNLSNQSDSRKGFRYIGKTETNENGFIFSFYASDAGEYNIYVTDNIGSYKEQVIQTIEKPIMMIDGGGIAGKKINIVASLPNAGIGAMGTLKISYPTDKLIVGSEPVTADNVVCSDVVLTEGGISLAYSITGENPKIYFAMGTDEAFDGNSIQITTEEFTFKNRYDDIIDCEYSAQKTIELVTAEDFNSAITNIVSAINNLVAPDAITAANYESVNESVSNCDNLIATAVAIGADKDADIPADALLKLSAVKSKLEEIKPVAEVLLELISKGSATDKYDFLKQKKDTFGINERTIEIIDNSETSEQILSDMFNVNNYTIEDVKRAVGSSVILNQLKVTKAAGVQGLLDDLEYLVGIDFPSMSLTVRTMIEKRTFETVEDVKKAIDAAIEAESNPPSTNPGGNGGTVGGGSVSGQISSGGKQHSSSSGSYAPVTTKPVQTEKKNSFSDMDEALWATEYVNKLYEQGIVNGDGNGKFRPNDSLTRAEFVKMLVSAAKLTGNVSDMSFDDVKPENWYYEYISIAVSNGIASGIGENLFGAADKLTRQDMVVLLYRTIKSDISGSFEQFSDSSEIADYAREAVGALNELNVISGFEDGSFKPYGDATRAMAAKVICVLLEGGLI